jgi:hypothetical protein
LVTRLKTELLAWVESCKESGKGADY